jgi:hypothetical protein
MPDFAPWYTPRYKILYVNGGLQHNIVFRFPRGTPFLTVVANGEAAVSNLFTPFADTRLWNDFSFIAAYVALTDDNIFGPAGSVPAPIAGTANPALANVNTKCCLWTFSGRSAESKGRVVAQGLLANPFAAGDPPETKWYILPAEEAAVSDALANLSGSGICGPDGTEMTFYDRVTIKHSDVLVRKLRRGTIGA